MKLSIPDMSCGHCKAVIEKTVAAQGAQVTVDLPARTATVVGAVKPDALLAALAAEGYPATIIG